MIDISFSGVIDKTKQKCKLLLSVIYYRKKPLQGGPFDPP
jgi:hypothetical protein